MSLTRVPITMFEPTSGGGSIVGLNNVVSNANSYVVGTGITTTLDNTTYVNNLSSLGFVSSSVLSGSYLYGDGSRLSNIYKAPSAATFSASVSAPAISGTHYGDGSNLTGVLKSSSGGNLSGNLTINNGSLTVFGNISATGSSTFVNTTFTTTSTLSVVNTGGGVTLWIGGNNNADIASFYDIDIGKEVLHVGGFTSGTPYVGINTSNPTKTLTVIGDISASNTLFSNTGTFYSSVSAPSIAGNGSNLTSLDASQLTTGTVNNDRLPAAGTFSSSVSAPALSGTHYGDGTFLTGVKDVTKLNLSGGVVSNYLHLGTGSLVISAGDLTLGSGNITTPGSVAIGGSLVRSKLDLNNKVIAGVQNIRGHADTGAWSLWGGLGTTDTDINGGNIALYGGSHPSTPNVVVINSSAGVPSATFNANGISLAKPLTANSGLTLFGNLSTNGVVTLGTTTINGNLSASGSATVGSLTSLGPVTISGTLNSSGLATLGGATIKGNLSASGTITSSDITLNSTAAQEGGQINFNRPSDNTASFALDVLSNVAGNNDSRFRVINVPASVELMTILSSGNVGIGTSAPGYKLEVNGGSFFNNLTSNSSVSFINGNTRISKNVVNNGLEFFTFNNSRMFIADTTGNVGIGTTSPLQHVHIKSPQSGTPSPGVGSVPLLIENSSAKSSQLLFGVSLANGDYNQLTQTGDQAIIFKADSTVADSVSGNLIIGPHSASGYGMRLTYDGKVGIGTSSPRSRLDVGSGVIAGVANIRGFANSGAYTIWGGLGTDSAVDGGYIQMYGSTHPTNPHNVYLGNSNYGTAISILSGGNVGIGTNTPAAQLTITGSGQATNTLNTAGNLGGTLILGDSNQAGGNGGALIFAANNQAWRFAAIKGIATNGNNNSVGDISFQTRKVVTDNALTENIRIVGNTGNVGIGNNNPSYKLDVTGNIKASEEIIVASTGNANQARFVQNNYGVIQRNDGTNFYLLATASEDQYGNWSEKRPFAFNLASGDVIMGHNVSVGGTVYAPVFSGTHYGDGSNLTFNTGLFIDNQTSGTYGLTTNRQISGASPISIGGLLIGEAAQRIGPAVLNQIYTAGIFEGNNGGFLGKTSIKENYFYNSAIYNGFSDLSSTSSTLVESLTGFNYSPITWSGLSGVCTSSDASIVAVWDSTDLWLSNSYGESFVPVNFGNIRDAAVSSSGSKLAAVTDTTNGNYPGCIIVVQGSNISHQHSVTYSGIDYVAIDMSTDGRIIAAVGSTSILISYDYGSSFNSKGPTTSANYNDIAVSSDGRTIIAVNNRINTSYDGGNTWSTFTLGGVTDYRKAAMSASGGVFVVSAARDGTIFVTNNNNHRSWLLLTPGGFPALNVAVDAGGKYLYTISSGGTLTRYLNVGTYTPVSNATLGWTTAKAVAISSDSKYIYSISSDGLKLRCNVTSTITRSNLSIIGTLSATALSGSHYGDGSNLSNLNSSNITTAVNGSKSGTYTLALADAGSVVSFNSTSSNICQIPANSVVPFAIGTQMVVIQEGTGTVTFQIVPSSGVDLKYYNNKYITSGQYSLATLVKVGTDSWRLGGTLS